MTIEWEGRWIYEKEYIATHFIHFCTILLSKYVSSWVSSVRIIGNGCEIQFKDDGGNEQCVLGAGDHYFATFSPACGNDRVTQYTVIQGPQGTLFI